MNGVNRIGYFDFLRGVAIIMVIGIHTYVKVPFDSLAHIWSINLRELLNFAVPLFLAISGFFIGKKQLNCKKEYFAFLKKQIPRVYVPVLLWSIPMALFMIIEGYSWINTLLKVPLCAIFGPYYFVCLIIQLYIAHPLFAQLAGKKLGGAAICLFNAVSLLLFSFVLTHYDLLFVILVGPFIYWVAFYYLGVYFAKHSRDYSVGWPIALLIMGALMQLFSAHVAETGNNLPGFYPTLRTYFHSLSAWVYEIAAVLLLFSQRIEESYNKYVNRSFLLRVITRVGEISFGVYLCHVYFLEVVSRMDFNLWIIRFLILSVISIGSIWLLRIALPQKAQKIIGVI